MEEQKKQKNNILSGFFDKCKDDYNKNNKPINFFGLKDDKKENNNIEKDKLKRIKEIIEE